MACSDQITTKRLTEAELNAITLGEIATSRLGAEAGGIPINTSTNMYGETTDTVQGRLNKLGVLYDDPIRDYEPSLLIGDLRAHRYPATTGDVYIPTRPTPFTTGLSFNTDDWVLLNGYSDSQIESLLIDDLSQAYEFTTVASLASAAIVFPTGKTINLSDRMTSFTFNIGGVANGFDILDAGNGNTATLIDKTRADHFGANGDGVFDNGSLITYLKSSGFKVHFTPGFTYRTTASFELSNGTEFHGNWSTLLCEHNLVLGDIASNCYIGEFIIDGDDRDHTSIPFRINSPSSNVVIGDMEWKNLHGITAFQTYGIYLPMYGASNFTIGDQRFINITQDDNGVVAGPGFVGGLYLVGFDAEVANGRSYGVVGDIYGQDIKTVDAGSGLVQDSDLIRAFAETNSTETFDITIGNVTGRNVAKRLVKAASCAGITIGNVNSFTDDVADGGITMHATVECLGSAINWKFGRVENEGPNTRVIWFQGATGCTAGDIYSGWGSIAAIFGGGGTESTDCSVGNITGKQRDGVSIGSGAYFFNSDNCSAGDVSGDFEFSVRCSNSENTGKNTVGDVSSLGKVDLTYGETHVGNLTLDASELQFNAPFIILGDKFKLTKSNITTDGARTVDIVGAIDGDIGDFNITRTSSSGGIDSDIAVISTEGNDVSGSLSGSIYVEVNNAILGTPVVTPSQSLVYLNNITRLDLDKLHLNVTSSTRGATGYNVWVDSCNGYIENFLVRSGYLTTSVIDGNITVDKAVNFSLSSTLSLTGSVSLFMGEKRTGNLIIGAANTPVIIDTTRT